MRLFISAGEPSGDMYGAALVNHLRRLKPQLEPFGMGGEQMKAAGVQLRVEIGASSVMGLSEVAGQLPAFFRKRRRLKRALKQNPPDAAVFIDFPDFHAGLLEFASRRGISTVAFIPPKAWAWRPKRARRYARAASLVVCVLPFAADFYAKAGANVQYAGHPLIGILAETKALTRNEAKRRIGADEKAPLLAILPGSRVKEIAGLAGEMIGAVRILRERMPSLNALAALPESLPESADAAFPPDLPVLRGRSWELLRAADAALVKSGTATLEAALMETPMVVAYRLSAFTYAAARRLSSVRFSALPNLLLNREVCPELYQENAAAAQFAEAVFPLLKKEGPERAAQIQAFQEAAAQLGDEKAMERIARLILKTADRSEPPHG